MKEKLYSNIINNIKDIRSRMDAAALKAGRDPSEVQLMAITKTVAPELVNIALDSGITLLGENRAQEMLGKVSEYHLDKGEVHFVGALQSNKVRQIIDHVTMIQSLDRLSLAKEIERQGKIRDRVVEVLVQVNVGKEETKSGVYPEKMIEFVEKLQDYPHIKVRGIMSIPPICDENEKLIEYFNKLRQLLVDIKPKTGDNDNVNLLSMGMSGDFETAIECGSTIVRIGTGLFGAR